MACDRFAEAIRENAYGLPLSADATAHLAVCSDCQAALETEERILATINTALEELTFVSDNHLEHGRAVRGEQVGVRRVVSVMARRIPSISADPTTGEPHGRDCKRQDRSRSDH